MHISFFYTNGDHRDLHSFPTRRSSDLAPAPRTPRRRTRRAARRFARCAWSPPFPVTARGEGEFYAQDRKSTRLNSSHSSISYAVFCLKKKSSTSYTFVTRSPPTTL